jgi:hypothetical protein
LSDSDDEYDPFWDDVDGHHFDRDGRVISMREWAVLRARGEEYIRIAQHHLDGYWVSTVWLGINHGWRPEEPPVIFETMVFATGADILGWDSYQDRYSTLRAAREGHERIAAALRVGLSVDEYDAQERRRLPSQRRL